MNTIRRAVRKIKREVKIVLRKRQARRMGITFVPPNFIFFPRLDARSIVVDGGCGYLADLSMHLIERYGLSSFGIDPTVKHRAHLERVEKAAQGRFHHLPLAIAAGDGFLTFYESREKESGSLLKDHTNALRPDAVFYQVEAVSLKSLPERIGMDRIDLLKLDLEGAEYGLFEGLSPSDLEAFDQIFIEFHHHAIDTYSERDTKRVVTSLCDRGFTSFSLDDHNYLFFRI